MAPIGLEELGIDGLDSTATTGSVGLGNPIDQILVVGGCLKFRRHGGESRKEEVIWLSILLFGIILECA